MLIGQVPLRDLTAQDVRRTLNKLAQTRSTQTMASTHNVLVRVIRHAEAGRDFRALCMKPSIEGVWAPRELRHTFVSVM